MAMSPFGPTLTVSIARATSWDKENAQPAVFIDPKSAVKICNIFVCEAFTNITCE